MAIRADIERRELNVRLSDLLLMLPVRKRGSSMQASRNANLIGSSLEGILQFPSHLWPNIRTTILRVNSICIEY